MKTKFISLILALLSSSTFVYAQENATKESLQETLDTYMVLAENLDMAGTFKYLPPKVLEMIPPEALEQNMDELFKKPGMHMKLYGSKITHIHDFVKTDQGVYTLVDYEVTMEMGLPEEEEETVSDAESEEEDELDAIEFTRSILAMQHGEENVKYDEEQGFFIIHAKNTMYAIYEKGFDGWKFFEKKDDGQGAVMMGIITEEVSEKLK
ncbi:MAG: hypothetical protein AAF696_30845 [Bacteroidota bacterium]